MNFKLLKTTITVVAIPLLLGASCGLKKKEKPQEQTSSSQETSQQPDSSQPSATDNSSEFIGRLTSAETRARKDFAGDAYLFAVKVRLSSNLNPQSATEKFLFASPGNTNFIYEADFSVSKDTVQRGYLIAKDYLKNQGIQDLASINSTNVKQGYLKALEMAEKNGGKDFRGQKSVDEILFTLKPGANLQAVDWAVDYVSQQETRSFEVNAETGDLLPSSSQPGATSQSGTPSSAAPSQNTPSSSQGSNNDQSTSSATSTQTP